MTHFAPMEGLLLMRHPDGHTVAIHLTEAITTIEPIVDEPPDPIRYGGITFFPNTTIQGYTVEMTGHADRVTLWTGPDPFAHAELEAPAEQVEA